MADISGPDPAVNDHVNDVADLMPFGEAYVEDYEVGVVQIDLGSRLGEDWPHDRAGVDGTGPEHRWWIETMGGERQDFSGPAADAPPAEIAAWVTRRAHEFESPAAVQAISARTIDIDASVQQILAVELIKYARWLDDTSFEETDLIEAEARGHRLDVPSDIFYNKARELGLTFAPTVTLGGRTGDARWSEVFHHSGWTPENAPEPLREIVAEVDKNMRQYLGLDVLSRGAEATVSTSLETSAARESRHAHIRDAAGPNVPEAFTRLVTQMSDQIITLQQRLAIAEERGETLSARETETRQALVNVARRLDRPDPAPTRATDATGPVVDHRSATTRGASVD